MVFIWPVIVTNHYKKTNTFAFFRRRITAHKCISFHLIYLFLSSSLFIENFSQKYGFFTE